MKFNYTDFQMSQDFPLDPDYQQAFKFFGWVFGMLPEKKQVLHNRPISPFCVVLKQIQ